MILVAGCSGGPAAPPSSVAAAPSSVAAAPPSPAAAPSRTMPLTTGPGVGPGERAPVLGADARRHTSGGALAFAVYLIKAIDWGYATNDPTLVDAVSTPSCTACSKYRTGIRAVTEADGWLTGGRISIASAGLVTGSFTIRSDYVVRVVLDESRIVITTPISPPRAIGSGDNHADSLIFVTWLSGAWRVDEIGSPS